MITSLKQRKTKFKPRIKLNHNRDVTKISTTMWWMKQLGFLLVIFFFCFPMKVAWSHIPSSWGKTLDPASQWQPCTTSASVQNAGKWLPMWRHIHLLYMTLRLHQERTKRRHGSHNSSHPPSQQIIWIDITNSGNNDSPCMYQVSEKQQNTTKIIYSYFRDFRGWLINFYISFSPK